jgi:ATP-dependent DNA helicase RecG
MATTPGQIDHWLQKRSENQNLEFKEAKNSFDREKLSAYCVAIANEGGGHLVLGVADKPPRRVIGSSAFSDLVDTTDKLFVKVGFRIDIEEVAHPDGRVVVFHIPSRPRGTAYHLDGRYLMRSGSCLVPMSEDRLRAIFAEGSPDWLEESSLADLSGQDVVDLLDTQTFFELRKQRYPTNQAGVLDRLASERLIDRTDSGYVICRLGGLLLAKELNAFPDLGRRAPRVVVYNGTSKLDTRIDWTSNRGYAVGFRELNEFVMSQLPQNEIIEDALRKRVKLLPDDSVRELVANALIHQSFLVHGAAPMIEVYSNRVEISNPGEPIVPVERFIDGYQSSNERLADMMRRMGICEEKGSGIDRVVHQAEVFQLPAPEFKAGHKRTIVTVFGPRPFDEMDRDDRVRACYQHCALRHVMSERMTNQSLRERFGLPESKAAVTSQIIAATMEAELIKPDESVGGSRKYARYLPFWA